MTRSMKSFCVILAGVVVCSALSLSVLAQTTATSKKGVIVMGKITAIEGNTITISGFKRPMPEFKGRGARGGQPGANGARPDFSQRGGGNNQTGPQRGAFGEESRAESGGQRGVNGEHKGPTPTSITVNVSSTTVFRKNMRGGHSEALNPQVGDTIQVRGENGDQEIVSAKEISKGGRPFPGRRGGK